MTSLRGEEIKRAAKVYRRAPDNVRAAKWDGYENFLMLNRGKARQVPFLRLASAS